MDKTTAQTTSIKISKEILSLNPSAIISLYSIDLTDIFLENGIKNVTGLSDQTIFRFHNQNQISSLSENNSIWFQNLEFIATPIRIEGLEQNAKGTVPRPKLSISVDSSHTPLLATLKEKIFELGDLTGARVMRQRTFVKYLDSKSFINPPADLASDPNVEFPRDIFFIGFRPIQCIQFF